MGSFRTLIVTLLMALLASLSALAATPKSAAVAPSDDPLLMDARLPPLEALKVRTELEQDRLDALALYATGRMQQQREEYDAALRSYQRAWRCDPDSLEILRQIVALAFRLNRAGEGVRYAHKLVELDPTDGGLLRQLAVQATSDGDYEKALELYEGAFNLEQGEQPTESTVLLAFQAAKLSLVAGKRERAAEYLKVVVDALNDPQQVGLSQRTTKVLIADAARTFELFFSGEGAAGASEEANAYRLFAESLLSGDALDAAHAAFEKVNELAPSEPLSAFDLARLHARRGEHEKALAKIEQYLNAEPTTSSMAPYEVLAESLKVLDREEELLERLEKLYAQQPDNVPLGYFLAETYAQADQLDQAEPLLRKLIAEKPTIRGYQALLGIYRRTNRPDELFDALSDALERVRILDLLGDEATALMEDEATVKALFDVARQRDADDSASLSPAARRAMAQLALETQQFDEAREFYTAALEAIPDEAGNLALQWGLGLLLREQYDTAVGVFQQALTDGTMSDDDPEVYYYLAGALELAGQTDAAVEAAGRSAELTRKLGDKLGDRYYRMLARRPWVLYHAKRHDEAASAYRELIAELEPVDSSSTARDVLREARMVLSNIMVHQGDLLAAEEQLELVLDEFPDDIGALNDLGYLWTDQGKRLHRSLRMVKQAVAEAPDNAAYRDSLGWAYYRLGRYQAAVDELRAAAALEEDDADAVILDHLGDAYLKLDDLDRARETWQRALEAFEEQEDAEHIDKVREKLRRHAPDGSGPDAADDE